jgi:hypothetical protein
MWGSCPAGWLNLCLLTDLALSQQCSLGCYSELSTCRSSAAAAAEATVNAGHHAHSGSLARYIHLKLMIPFFVHTSIKYVSMLSCA